MSDLTDSVLDSTIIGSNFCTSNRNSIHYGYCQCAGFPETYQAKVGKTSNGGGLVHVSSSTISAVPPLGRETTFPPVLGRCTPN
eukprot:2117874-Amphidinium_carterae.1